MRWLLPFLFWLPMAWAGDAEREGIEAERHRLIEQFSKEERECQQRFAVTDCIEDVHRRRREALDALRARELDLDDAERKRRAEQRRAAVEAKQKAQAARPPAALSPEALPPAGLPPADQPPAALPPEAPPRKVAPPVAAATPGSAALPPRSRADDSQARAAQAAERAQSSQRRRAEAQAALERVQRRLAEREASGKVAAPLPLPDAASAPGR